MFCPSCRDEFRPGFTRCGHCNVDLVEALSASSGPTPRLDAPPKPPAPLIDFCGFLDLGEAQSARGRVREAGIRCEVVLREAAEEGAGAPGDEFWLRVEATRLADAEALLEREILAPPEEEDFACSACGQRVAASEAACPHCGAAFDED